MRLPELMQLLGPFELFQFLLIKFCSNEDSGTLLPYFFSLFFLHPPIYCKLFAINWFSVGLWFRGAALTRRSCVVPTPSFVTCCFCFVSRCFPDTEEENGFEITLSQQCETLQSAFSAFTAVRSHLHTLQFLHFQRD